LNNQPIEKRRHDGDVLDVHSIFNTIQGEGPFTGKPAVFIRLAGCNLQCPLCDTDYTTGRHWEEVASIVQAVKLYRNEPSLVVITGGEPFRQNLTPLVNTLVAEGYTVQIETNGTLPLSEGLEPLVRLNPAFYREGCFIVCSPKAGRINQFIHQYICAYKYVLSHDSVDPEDGLPILALDHSAHPRVARPGTFFQGPVYLQPCDTKDTFINRLNQNAVVESCMKHGYTLQLQIHKILGVD